MLLAGMASTAAAQDDDRALAPFVRATTAGVRGSAVDAIEWERRLRAAQALGPRPGSVHDRFGLVAAARAGQDERVRELLRRGAEVDGLDEQGFTALGAAAWAGRRSTVRVLVRAGADARRLGASGQTALHLAAIAGQVAVIDELLRLKVDVELLNRQNESALDAAAAIGQQDAMTPLLAAGADTQRAGQR